MVLNLAAVRQAMRHEARAGADAKPREGLARELALRNTEADADGAIAKVCEPSGAVGDLLVRVERAAGVEVDSPVEPGTSVAAADRDDDHGFAADGEPRAVGDEHAVFVLAVAAVLVASRVRIGCPSCSASGRTLPGNGPPGAIRWRAPSSAKSVE